MNYLNTLDSISDRSRVYFLPIDSTGILIMKGDYNRIANNVMSIADTNSKVVINGTANNNLVIYSTEGSAFQNGENQSNKNIGI